jgi:hypothetical protein
MLMIARYKPLAHNVPNFFGPENTAFIDILQEIASDIGLCRQALTINRSLLKHGMNLSLSRSRDSRLTIEVS